jgi:hypothetical protein
MKDSDICSNDDGFAHLSVVETSSIGDGHVQCQIVQGGGKAQFLLGDGASCADSASLGAILDDELDASCMPLPQDVDSCTNPGNECFWTVQVPSCPEDDNEENDGTERMGERSPNPGLYYDTPCMEDNWKNVGGNIENLTCASRDVYLDSVENLEQITCKRGEKVKVTLLSSVHFTSGQFDAGWYIAQDSGDALTGTCAQKSLSMEEEKFEITGGSIFWNDTVKDLEGRNDMCGEVAVDDGGANLSINFVEDVEITCIDRNGDGFLDISICFSWRTAESDDTCDPMALYPGSASKCFCTTYDVENVTVEKTTTHSTCI